MRSAPMVIVLCAARLLLAREVALCSEVPSVEELEKKAITYRLENIKQGNMRLRVIDDTPSTECLFDITFDEHRTRQIRRYRMRGKTDWSKPEKIIVTPDRYITDHEDTTNPVVVEIAPAIRHNSPREHFGILNVQALGMSPNGAARLAHAHVEMLMNRSDRTPPKVHADIRVGINTWRIDYEIKNGEKEGRPKVSLWVSPSQGFSVVGIEFRSDQDGHRYTSIVDSQMRQYPDKGFWYPSKLIMTSKEDDRITNRQEVIVEEARFGGPIDEIAFTPSGLELKPGQKVVDSSSGVPWLKVWDGKELADPSQVKVAAPSSVHHKWLLVILAVGLGLMAAFYFWRVIKHRRSVSNLGA